MKQFFRITFISSLFLILVSQSYAKPEVYIIEPQDNAVLKNPIRIIFGLRNKGIAPAGVDHKNTGHHHLLLNLSQLPNLKQSLPSNKNIIHFGGGQTETEIKLPPGKHSLQLLLGDHLHIPHQAPIISKKIWITVEK